MSKVFKDHFSGNSKNYSKYRPDYSSKLYELIFKHVTHFDAAWDCGTGNGQVASYLSGYFNRVEASDASEQQIKHAIKKTNINYKVSKSEHTEYVDLSFDLITVGQALHWFDFELFWKEVKRVAKPNAILAVWTYRLMKVNKTVDAYLHHFFEQIKEYWPQERAFVDQKYDTIPFPDNFKLIGEYELPMTKEMSMMDALNYLRTWSSVKNYVAMHGVDPVKALEIELEKGWRVDKIEKVVYPTSLKVFRI